MKEKDIMKEEWKDISEYEGIYQISNKGRLKSIDRMVRCRGGVRLSRGKVIKTHINKMGYPFVCLYKNGEYKGVLIHRIVAQTFLKNPLNKKEVNHIDGIKNNNDIINLEWVTRSENAKHSYAMGLQKGYNANKKLDDIQVLTIRTFSIDTITNSMFSNLYNIERKTLSNIRTSKTYKYLPKSPTKTKGRSGDYQKNKANRISD